MDVGASEIIDVEVSDTTDVETTDIGASEIIEVEVTEITLDGCWSF